MDKRTAWLRLGKALLALGSVAPPFWAACKAIWPYLAEIGNATTAVWRAHGKTE